MIYNKIEDKILVSLRKLYVYLLQIIEKEVVLEFFY